MKLSLINLFFLGIVIMLITIGNRPSERAAVCLTSAQDSVVVQDTIPIEEKYPEVKELLILIPQQQRDSFVSISQRFAKRRGLDWRFLLYVFYQESGIQPTLRSGNYAGICQFGSVAREMLGVSMKELLSMNHVQQLRLAIRMWKMSENWRGMIHTPLDLVLLNFAPAWVGHKGNPYPASQLIINSNPAVVDNNGQITKHSILKFIRRKVARDENLAYFVGKI